MTNLIETKPAPGKPAEWTFPTVSRTSADGVTVVASHLPGRPIVSLNVTCDAGAVTDPAGKQGVANLTVSALTKGARGLDEEALAIAFESVGASPGGSASYDNASFGLSAPAGLLGEAAELLADVVRRPTLDGDEIAKLCQQSLDGFKASEANAGFVAGRAGRTAYYAPDSRYAVAPNGTPESVASIEADDVRAFHAERWAQAPLTVIVVGDLAGVDLDGIASAFKASTATPAKGATSEGIVGGGRRIVLSHMKGAVQSVISVTAPGPKYDIPDAAELSVAQAVVVAAFSARVNLRLREDLGYTYGASGAFQRSRDLGTLALSTQVRNDVTAETVKEAFLVLEGSIGDKPLTDDEVEQARENLVSKFAVQYDGAGAVAQVIANRVVHDLADDERDVMLSRLRTVTTDQANACWRAYANFDEAVVSIAGDAGAIRESLESLGLPIVDA